MENFQLNPINNDTIELIFDMPNQKVNKLSINALLELDGHLDEINKSGYKTVVIKSAKSGIFVAGADIKEIEAMNSHDEVVAMITKGNNVFNKLSHLKQTTIALIEGACMGGGLELILSCDFRVAIETPKTKMAFPEVKIGVIPGLGGTQRLPQLIGIQNALGIILTGSSIDSKKAYKLGLVDLVIPKGYENFRFDEFLSILESKKESIIARRKSKKPLEQFGLFRNYMYKKAHESLMQKTKGFYPAPLSALKVIKQTFDMPVEQGLKIETDAFSQLALSEVCKNLISLFFASQRNETFKVKPKEIKNSAMLGSGVMGRGIAWFFSNIGINVRLIEPMGIKLVGVAISEIKCIYTKLVKRRKLTQNNVSFKMNSITYSDKYDGLHNTDLIVEAVLENEKVKNQVFASLEENTNDDTILATNTSSISINKLAKDLKRKENFVGLHFFNPVNKMPLVEIIPSQYTSEQTLSTLYNFIKKGGKTPVIVQDCAGFLVNRILIPYVNEALHLVSEGVEIKSIDKALKSFGMPMGPIELVDSVGIDIGYHVLNILHEAYGERMEPATIIDPVFNELKLLGTKSGKGFYTYAGKERTLNEDINQYINKSTTLSDELIVQRTILVMINEASRTLEEHIVPNAGTLDIAMIYGTGFPPFRGGLMKYADSLGAKHIEEKLLELKSLYGSRFEPSALITKLAKNNKSFY